ncbi:NAD-dependent epimerase/dehydratase family protein [Ewingella americana]|uniref:NAD-dependent epimerase/dehydratase family protein n=1 Tax=Ewingella americana TaxID=41202 RepID=UPI00163B35C1|nr:NAD-dependent epimerase/dehydratase family protein [Ewingella americana]QMV51959.1 NAD-dependent epimerase/dehydratase family protein [Ewingella americana]
MKILITGATGFVGSGLIKTLEERKYHVVGTSRQTRAGVPSNLINVGDISETTDWSSVLQDCNTVVHTAGRAHILDDRAEDKLAEFRRVNCAATLKLAHDAENAGVKHFIFISSIGVNGNKTEGVPFNELSIPQPTSDYAISKLEAEQALQAQFANSPMSITIIRPALICGENAPGNIRRLLKIVASGLPLPFKGIKNKRGMVSLDNVISFIVACIENESSRNELFVLADNDAPSTEEIVGSFSSGMNKPPRVIWFPSSVLGLLLKIAGKKNLYEQLFGSLEIDASKSVRVLNWQAPVTIFETMEKTAKYYSKENK